MNYQMKTLTTALFLILFYSNSFWQRQPSPLLSDVINTVKDIDAYVNEVNKNPKLFPISLFDSPEYI